MKIIIQGSKKEIADLVLSVQGQQGNKPVDNKIEITHFFDLLAKEAGMPIRQRRQLKEDTSYLASFIKNRLGLNVDSADIDKHINGSTSA